MAADTSRPPPPSARSQVEAELDSDHHVRVLLDQRNMRADVPTPSPHTRYSIFSDRSDSPSLYSHFDASNYRTYTPSPIPEVPHFNDMHAYSNDIHYPRSLQHQVQHNHPLPGHPPQPQHPSSTSHPLSPKQRLADPNASSLDLTADSDAYSDSASRIDDDDESESNLVPASDEDPDTRISLMGPKMRVHSRAPWEEDGDDVDVNSDSDDGGNDTLSVFGGNGKKSSGRSAAVMRGLGFGGKGVAPRPSFDSIIPGKVKRSFETTSSGHTSTPRGAIQTLAQASVSSTSLALGASTSANRLPHKLSMGRLALNRDRTVSGPSSACTPDRSFISAPFTSPLSATVQDTDDDSPVSLTRHMESAQQHSIAMARTRSPSPIADDGHYTHHPYANPVHVSQIPSGAGKQVRRDQSQEADARSLMARDDTISSFTASEETVMISHSSSIASATTSSLSSSTPATSDFSIVSPASQSDLSRYSSSDADRVKREKYSRRETKLGPISGPAFIGSNFPANKPYNLISLGEAQARAKEKNRSATTGGVPPAMNSFDADERAIPRPRAASASTQPQPLPVITFGLEGMYKDDKLPSAVTPSPVGPPSGRTVRNKRSGFMKLFNGREKDRLNQDVPPLPIAPISNPSAVTHEASSHTPKPQKTSASHRVPVPPLPPSPRQSEEVKTRKPAPALTIKVSTPPATFTHGLEAHPRRSDSPKGSNKSTPLQIPVSAPAGVTEFPALKLRPVSGFFATNFGDHLLTDDQSPSSPRTDAFSLLSPSTISSNEHIPSPVNTGGFFTEASEVAHGSDNPDAVITALKEQIRTYRKVWQRQIWELEGQVRDLKSEIDDLKSGDTCDVCGRGAGYDGPERKSSNGSGVLHRPRAKTGHGARFASGNDT